MCLYQVQVVEGGHEARGCAVVDVAHLGREARRVICGRDHRGEVEMLEGAGVHGRVGGPGRVPDDHV